MMKQHIHMQLQRNKEHFWQKYLLGVVLALLLTAVAAPAQTAHADSERDNNREAIYEYLTEQMQLNPAAASGILANLQAESWFNPKAVSPAGAYGICQWMGGRKTKLFSYCEENGYAPDSLEGQLHYLEYELSQKSYQSILEYLQQVENSAQGAYNAGHYWCYHFERPGNLESTSAKRGALARDTYWPMFKDYVSQSFLSNLEEPANGSVHEEAVRIKGWVIARSEITEVRCTNGSRTSTCKRSSRPDVAAAYPGYPTGKEGFSLTLPLAELENGSNTLQLTAYTKEKSYVIGTVTIEVKKDTNAPIISNVVVSDISEEGYTVTCQVEDEQGIDRVQFPTWTQTDGQDDLVSDWKTSEKCSGTVEGTTVTYRVSVGDHYYESGVYYTHIYAYDTVGNVAVAIVPDVLIKQAATEPPIEYLLGDPSGDKLVNSVDALWTLKYVVGLQKSLQWQKKAADVDGSGSVEAVDALAILKKSIHMIDRFPAE